MAITKGTVTSASLTTDQFDTSFYKDVSITVASGETVLNVRVIGASSRMPPSSLTFNGAALTLITGTSLDDGNQRAVAQYDLVNPDEGTFNLTIRSAAETTYRVIVTPLSGVDTASPRRDADSASGFNTTPTVTLTTVAGDLVLDAGNSLSTPTPDGSQAQDVVADAFSFASSEVAAETSTVMSWSQADNRWVTSAVAYVPAPPSGPSAAALAFFLRR